MARTGHAGTKGALSGNVRKIHRTEDSMDEEALNRTVRKFLKNVGVTSQREIEIAVRDAVAAGKLKGNESLPATATITLGGVDLNVTINGEIDLQ
jgi:hypothetical protein